MPEIKKEIENKGVVKFKKPYKYEDKEYSEIDLSSVADLSAEELIEAESILSAEGKMSMVPEVSLPYLLIIASIATKLPTTFFTKLPAPVALKVKNKVLGFLNNPE